MVVPTKSVMPRTCADSSKGQVHRDSSSFTLGGVLPSHVRKLSIIGQRTTFPFSSTNGM